ncbi:MAG: 3-phosphoglycerate dehydrogenase [Lachnospiraceae bacterium]|nr:3-phosphoglycerate dehydrogenase [Lachnospiraceae bacterium]
MIQKWGVGYDKIDIEEAGKRNIPVMISSGGNSMPVAELTVALMLDVLRNVTVQCEKLKEGNWAREQYAAHSYMLHGKTVGLIGMGNIARKVAAIVVRGFGCNVLYYDLIHLSDEEERKLQVKSVSLDQLLAESDIVSIHIPLLESTEGMIDRSKIMLMKQNACLINTSRGRVVNEQDLVEALRAKRILGAGLDTFSVEPLPQNSPLLTMENVIVTPHCGGNTADNDDNMARICMNLITEYANSGNANKQATVNAAYLR